MSWDLGGVSIDERVLRRHKVPLLRLVSTLTKWTGEYPRNGKGV